MSELSNRPEPYVGVSGVVGAEQQKRIEDFAESIGLHEYRRLALGVKAVHKTQFLDIEDVSSAYSPQWFPVGHKAFEQALAPRSETTTSLGIAQTFFDPDYVGNPGYREYFTARLLQRGAQWIDGIQFDTYPWHSNPQLLEFLRKVKDEHTIKLLLQVHKPAMQTLGPQGVAELLSEYSDVIDYALFNTSNGTGTALSVDNLRPFLEEAYETEALNSIGFTVAGGLNETTVRETLPQLLEAHPDLSWDAEGQLHSPSSRRTRPLDIPATKAYLQASVDVMKTNNQHEAAA